MACLGLPLPLRRDVATHSGFVRSSDGLGKVAISPQAVSPKKLLQLREFFSDNLARSSLQVLDGGGQRYAGRELEEHVHMVRHDREFMNIPPVHPATLVEQMGEASDELSLKYSPAIFGDEYHMVHETVE